MSTELLVVEDSIELLTIWRSLFELTTSYVIKYCRTCAEAHSLINNGFRPELIITDYFLGDGNGLDILDQLTALDQEPHCLIVTGKSVDDKIFQNLDYQSCRFLQKPVKFEELKEAVELLLQDKLPSAPSKLGDSLDSQASLQSKLF